MVDASGRSGLDGMAPDIAWCNHGDSEARRREMMMDVQDTSERRPRASESSETARPLVWQRTDTVGTELVFPAADGRTAAGSAVVGGTGPHSIHWQAALDDEGGVRDLTLTCESAQSRRTLTMSREQDGTLAFRAGDEAEATRLEGIAVVRITDSPIFVTWAIRRLRLSVEKGAVRAMTARVLLPSLTVATGTSVYQLVSDRRLRVGGDEAATVFDLDEAGIVTYRPGRLRRA
jgi:hypothetical protein